MINLKTTKNKFIIITIVEIIFTILLILLLVFSRQKSIEYLQEIQFLSQDIALIEQDLQTQNVSTYDQEKVANTINNLDSKIQKGLIFLKVILPISIILLSLIFYFIIWKINTNISIKRFLQASIIPIFLTLAAAFFTLNYISYSFYFVEENPIVYLIISIILLIITYYISLFLLIKKTTFKKTLKLAVKNIPKITVSYIIMLIANLIYFMLIFILFFMTYAEADILIPSIAIFILIIILNFQRIHLTNKILKL
ncbi:hypothetical protein J4216_05395 [Candidatus Woesearchaeota archaeon]|nr:hypothetical protein [Candidatus Woesearchaeota archaeon]